MNIEMHVAMKIFMWLFSFAVTVLRLMCRKNYDLPFVGGKLFA